MSALSKRVASIDILRGIVMIIMALDHTRDYFSDYKADLLDVQHVPLSIFFTRWVTHFCAPVFIFLSGTGAFLSFQRGRSKKEASLFLLTRGLWLVLLELTIVRFGWAFNLDYSFLFAQVIWAIGWSMVCLSAIIFLPYPAILTLALTIIFCHNLLDGIHAAAVGDWWKVIHEQGPIRYGAHDVFFVAYPLIPWIGVMAAGYCFGAVFNKEAHQRDRWLIAIGTGAMVLFVLLRWSGFYGDPNPWRPQPSGVGSVLSFIKCEKYPPSLLYLLMTLGPAIAIMPLLEKWHTMAGRFFTVYGRVPMFYYILHIYLIHAMALALGLATGFHLSDFTANDSLFGGTKNWGFPLTDVYLFWLSAVLLLYFPCRWWMHVKMKDKKWWHSYI